MADLQEVLNPVNNTGSNPPENSIGGNVGEIQTNSVAEQPGILNQAQEVTPIQPIETPMQEKVPTPVAGPDLSGIEPSILSESTGPSVNEAPISHNEAHTESINPANSQAAINATKKEKLAQLIKAEQKKGEKSGFMKGVLSGVAITACILAVSVIFAKDQIVNLLSDENTSPTSLEASVVDITPENTNEENNVDNENANEENLDEERNFEENSEDEEDILADEDDAYKDKNTTEVKYLNEDDEDTISEDKDENIYEDEDDELFEKYYSEINDIIESDIDEEEKLDLLEQILSRNPKNEDLTEYINMNIMNIYNKISQAYSDKEETEDKITEDSNTKELYTITHVDLTGEANWVLPAHCTDLTCYGEDKEFSPCTTFKLVENLDENANRIGNNGSCRYKDKSELVYVKL